MRFKLDENANPRWRVPLEDAGHDVSTVADECLQGAKDSLIAEICRAECRCLITADLGFAQVLEYPPDQHPGIIVLRHPKPTLSGMGLLIRQIVAMVEEHPPAHRLWIVEPGRIRIHGFPPDQAQ